MADFVQLWVYMASTPLFGLTATLVTYVLAQAFYARVGHAPWANPVLWSVAMLGLLLLATRTPYPAYFAGAQFVHVLLGPAVVALGWPLWLRREALRRRGAALVLAALAGGTAAAGSALALGWALGLPADVLRSLAPKSVTAPVAMGIAERLGGIPALAALFAVLTGMVGALSAKYLFDGLGVRDWAVRGFALGTAAHGIGAARALQVHPDAGAYAGMALGLQVLLAALLMPLAARFLG
ncbi:LrgB family protein [Azohydromonas aeria]|uniref:LrgB family protein n=1 Tax=Azohydromonas aeria TaxID=2590212 RepID=UPI0012FAFFF4|nr:LrgB family protein [Azohydromonas aeria]